MSFFEQTISFITDNSKKLSTRAAVIGLFLVFGLFLDNVFSVSFYFNKQRQLNYLQSIATLQKDTTLTAETRAKLLELEKQTFDRKNIIEHTLSFFLNLSWTNSKVSESPIDNTSLASTRNNFLFLLSSSGVFVSIAVLSVAVLFLDRKTPFIQLLASVVFSLIVTSLLALLNFWLFATIIPDQIFGSWTWNYVINFVLQTNIILGLIFTSKKVNG